MVRRLAWLSIIALVGLDPGPAHASDVAVWQSALVQWRQEESGGRLWLDVHARRNGAAFVGIVRPALGWDLTETTSVFVGYAFVPTWSPGGGRHEHRFWQQALIAGTLDGGVTFQLRPRLEQRTSPQVQGVGWRARSFQRVGLPIRDPLGLVVWNEIFLAPLPSAWSSGVFDQHRLFLGPSVAGRKGTRVEVGYLHLLLGRPAGAVETQHVVVTNLFGTF